MYWPFTVWINRDFKNFANAWPSASNFKSFSQALEHFFLTIDQNDSGNKIQFFPPLYCCIILLEKFRNQIFLMRNRESIQVFSISVVFNRFFENTGGPPLTRNTLTRFPLTRFLAYARVSGGISVSRGPQYSPTNTSFM